MSTSAPGSESSGDVTPLRPIFPLSDDNFHLVADFTCARPSHAAPWEQDVSAWIKAPRGARGALDAVQNGDAEVWLFEDRNGRLIGFVALGIEFQTASVEGTPETVYNIPYFGIHSEFRGKPDGPREQRYSWRIFQGVIDEAERRGEHALLTLYVDPNNPAYQGFYPLFGFVEIDRVTLGEREWVRMARRLNPPQPESTPK